MDIDGSGFIESGELMLLGQARRKLEQKEGEWTDEMNERIVTRMSTSGDSKVSPEQFAKYFDRALPGAPSEFNKVMKEFWLVADYCKARPEDVVKKEQKAEGKKSAAKVTAAKKADAETALPNSRQSVSIREDLMPPELRAKVAALFACIDLDGGGTISIEEIKQQHGGQSRQPARQYPLHDEFRTNLVSAARF
jgi:hypothetical protein